MKNIVFLIIGLLISSQLIGQTPKSDVVSVRLPHGATSLTKEQLSKVAHNNFKRSGVPLDVENYYQLDGLIISFWDIEVNPDFNRSLEEIRSGMVAILKRNNDTVNFSKIITVNNIQFLEYEYQKDDEVYLRFQSEFNKNHKNICGIIQFKKPDQDKAHKALQDLLQSIHFKDQ
jgi:hypothetical protein